MSVERVCAWCDGPIPATSRRDAKYCVKRCRQAAHRFTRAARGHTRRVALRGRAFRFAYADPPYPGKAQLYRDHPDFAGEVDHRALVDRLVAEFPDGWALSTSAESLRDVLPLCPSDARVASWVRGERPTRSYWPLNAWEPVIYVGGRPYATSIEARRLDVLQLTARPRLTDPRRVIGAKPAAFCRWMFDLLGALPGDELVDLFPGSGRVADAWSIAGVEQITLDDLLAVDAEPSCLQAAAERDASLRGSARRVALAGGGD
jgi:16S rRNA G966 N2-methylase RsmD